MGSFDFVTFFFFVAAVIVFIQLRAVLGKSELDMNGPRSEQMERRDQTGATPDGIDDPKVVTLPRRGRENCRARMRLPLLTPMPHREAI
jgi:predicted lipid-binding transport protein (Tim44 family)